MNFIERYNNLVRIAKFIKQGKTGNPEEFAQRCNLNSTDALFTQIDILRHFTAKKDANILYNRNKETYYFDPIGKFSDFEFEENTC